MSKCISCQAELPPQSRFCGTCGATQPSGTSADEPENIETIRSNPPAENTPANIPPPPPQLPPNTGEIQKREIAPSGQEEPKPPTNSLPGQPNNPPSGPRPQPQTFYSDQPQAQHLQQPFSNYQPQQSQSLYGGYPYGPQSQPLYGGYQQPQQPQSPYGGYQQPPQPQPPYGGYQQPPQPQPSYGGHQQPPQPQPSYGDYPPTQLYGDYQQPPQPAELHAANTIANVNTGMTGGTPITTPGPQPIPITGPGLEKKPPVWRNKWVIIAAAAVVVLVLGGSGILTFLLLPKPPIPTISVTSDYHYNGTPAGALGTKFVVKGQKFAANSPITFQLDTKLIRDSMQEQSDASGSVTADLTVTSDWSVGPHTLTAHDASNNATNTGVTINVVQQGSNGTPGPNGSPTNTADFKVAVTFHESFSNLNILKHLSELDVKGLSDSQGGSVCSPKGNGSSQDTFPTTTGPNGTPLTEVMTYICNSTSIYKDGRLTYDETLLTDEISDDGGLCQLSSSHAHYILMNGTYKNQQDEFGGEVTLSIPGSDAYTCRGDLSLKPFNSDTFNGTWTGTVSTS